MAPAPGNPLHAELPKSPPDLVQDSAAESRIVDGGFGESPAPTVSVLIPVYNGAETVSEAVQSIRKQEFPFLEILLINDGSRDASAKVLSSLLGSDSRVRVLTNDRNMGLSWTLNRGLHECRGDLVLVLHQDCALCAPNWISSAVPSFADPRVISVVGSPRHDVEKMDRLERIFWIVRHHVTTAPSDSVGGTKLSLFSENKCDLFRREPILSLGGFDGRLREGGEDQVLAWKLSRTEYHVVHRDDLPFAVSLGKSASLSSHLRKDQSYGRQMRQVLLITRFGAIRRSSEGSVDVRLTNRATGVAWILASLAVIVLALVLRNWTALLFAFVPPFLRGVQLAVRGLRQQRAYGLRRTDVARIALWGLLADLSYAIGMVTPGRGATAAHSGLKSSPSVP